MNSGLPYRSSSPGSSVLVSHSAQRSSAYGERTWGRWANGERTRGELGRTWRSSGLSVVAGWCLLVVSCWGIGASLANAQTPLILQGENRLAMLDAQGKVTWEMPWGAIHDLHRLPNGHIMVQRGAATVAEIDPQTKQVVWEYDAQRQNAVGTERVEVHAFQPLENGHVMIAESGRARIIEIDRQGKLVHQIKLRVEHPDPHTDTRLARQLANGHYLVCHEADGAVREYDHDGQMVWEYRIPFFGEKPRDGHGPEAYGNKVFSAVRLPNGNTLIGAGNGHRVLEVTPQGAISWQIDQHELPGITLAWVTTVEVLPNGHYLIGNCHAGPGQPLVIELDPRSKRVVWQLDQFEQFGNSVSNSLAVQ